jgi:alanyl-tRNA synthetase
VAEVKASAKERQRLRHELAEYHATQLVVEELIEDHLRVVRRAYTDRDAEYVKLLASQLAATAPQTVALLASLQQDAAFVVMSRSHDLDFHCGELLKEAMAELGLRAGGSADLAQGQVPRAPLERLMSSLETGVRTAQQRSQPAT